MPGPGTVTRGYSCSTEMPVPGLVGRDVCWGRAGGCFQHADFQAEGVTFSNITICCCTGELWVHPHFITILLPSICAGADLGILTLVPLILLPPPAPRSLGGSEQETPATWSPYSPCPGTWLRRWVGNITLCFTIFAMFCLCPPQFCWSRRGHLAEIKSKDEEDTLDQYLVHGILYWIGLSDLAVEGRMEDDR